MAINNINRKVAYGLSQPLLNVQPAPIVSDRNPTTQDKAQIGQQWVNQATNIVYFLTSYLNGGAVWTTTVGGGTLDTLTGNIGGAVGPTGGNINLLGSNGILITGNPGTSSFDVMVNGDFSDSFITDAGTATPAANAITIAGGTNINTAGAGSTVTINLNDSIGLPNTNAAGTTGMYQLGTINFMHNYGTSNTFLGQGAGNLTLTVANAIQNVGIGTNTLNALVGTGATNGSANVALGYSALELLTDGSGNTALGTDSLSQLLTGEANIAIGPTSGSVYTGAESSNILISNAGVVGESNTIRIGADGSGTAEQDRCFIAGINGVTVASPVFVTIDNVTSQLGVDSGGIVATVYNTDNLSATPAAGSLNVVGGLNMNTAAPGAADTIQINLNTSISLPNTTADELSGMYSLGGTRFLHKLGSENVFLGEGSGNLALTTALGNTCVGYASCDVINTASNNTAIGQACLTNLIDGTLNCAIGAASLAALSSASNNTGCGTNSLRALLTGSDNIALGQNSGQDYMAAESSNIVIGSQGVTGESNVIRIGTQGTGAGQQNSCFIAGIAGVTVANSAAVLIDTNTGELGTIASSIRFKENITDMGEKSSAALDLRPVNFNFIKDESKANQWGLIAEEVLEVFPELVVFDTEGVPSSVRYHDLPVILLNEIKKLQKRIEYLENK